MGWGLATGRGRLTQTQMNQEAASGFAVPYAKRALPLFPSSRCNVSMDPFPWDSLETSISCSLITERSNTLVHSRVGWVLTPPHSLSSAPAASIRVPNGVKEH